MEGREGGMVVVLEDLVGLGRVNLLKNTQRAQLAECPVSFEPQHRGHSLLNALYRLNHSTEGTAC